MNDIQIFKNEQFGCVRTITISGEPWFVAADVCGALGIGNPSDALRRLDEDEKALVSIEGFSRGNDSVNIINEYGLYTLVLGSRKPQARDFKRWITHEVIPSIRKHGAYVTDTKLAQLLADPRQAHLLVMELVHEQLQNERLAAELAETMPKARYYDTFVNPRECTNIRITAKELGVPERRFVHYLLDHRYLYRAPSGRLMPYMKFYAMGFFIIRDFHLKNSPDVGHYTLFTARGKEHFMYLIPEILKETA